MVKQSNLDRGKKWARIMKEAELRNEQKEIEWMNSQEAIKEDIRAYEESLKPVKAEKPKEEKETKSKKGK